MEAIQSMASEFIVTLALGIITLLAAYATYGIRKVTEKVKLQTQQIKEEEKRNLLLNALDDVSELTEKVVGSIEQTTAKSLRELVADGKADRAELEALAKKAAAEITQSLTPEAQRVIEENFGNFEKYLSACIESKVLELKSFA
ncbi:hypothetical protein KUA25_06090 [Bacteroidales bacterium MSK.15.36]|nr:hypothetical protein [Bacteroidales bacterium MSK.15.36]